METTGQADRMELLRSRIVIESMAQIIPKPDPASAIKV